MSQTNASTGAGPSHNTHVPRKYKKREKTDFSTDEQNHLTALKDNPLLRKLRISRFFEEPIQQLENWLHFFDSTDHTYGGELQQGLVYLWSSIIVVETLLAAIAIQPFTNPPAGLEGGKRAWYGMLWMWALLADFLGLGTTTLFLGYLFTGPGKLNWVWACKIGALRGIPAILVLWATIMSLAAIAFTSFILYGKLVGIVCVVVEALIVFAGTYCATSLNKAWTRVFHSEL
ncbi:hypothetical protein M758_1G326900 [Ceratodon purpureus]|uniref:Uncharacterized protein n=1 Tax=Ceratodon purpureus TaxID=3225 RepID=A0A8T0JDP1_CERPU|nr:hypothetical protein KC19_1G334600 [Ceratodon purpureus]KAG0632417.1 hypothetical protein M758_1G326900 [Ceratodon purpureus]